MGRRRVGWAVAVCLGSWGLVAGQASARDMGSRFVPVGSQLFLPDASAGADFGAAMALSADGSTLLVGGPGDAGGAGAAWIFQRSGSGWQESAELTDPQAGPNGRFGTAVALSGDGDTALVAAAGSTREGTVDVFARTGTEWAQQGSLVPHGLQSPPAPAPWGAIGPSFGSSVALSADGTEALVGAETDSCYECGAMVAFARSGTSWSQQGSPLRPDDLGPVTGTEGYGSGGFGGSVALSADGSTALVGDASDAVSCGVLCHAPGAVWAYTRQGEAWVPDGAKLSPSGSVTGFGTAEALSANGREALLSATPSAVPLALQGSPAVTPSGALARYPASPVLGGAGEGVALSGDGAIAVVGNGNACGADTAESFVRSSEGWAAEPALAEARPPTPSSGDVGPGVAVSGDGRTAVVADPSSAGPAGSDVLWTDRRTSAPFVAPDVRRVTTGSGRAGDHTLTITGRGFTGVTRVVVRGTPGAAWCVVSPREIILPDLQGLPQHVTRTSVLVTTPAGNSRRALVPGAVTHLHARARRRAIVVSFRRAHRTGFPITYAVHAVPHGPTVHTRRRRIVLRGLTAGRYRFVVMARDRFGTGPPSQASNRVRVRGPAR